MKNKYIVPLTLIIISFIAVISFKKLTSEPDYAKPPPETKESDHYCESNSDCSWVLNQNTFYYCEGRNFVSKNPHLETQSSTEIITDQRGSFKCICIKEFNKCFTQKED